MPVPKNQAWKKYAATLEPKAPDYDDIKAAFMAGLALADHDRAVYEHWTESAKARTAKIEAGLKDLGGFPTKATIPVMRIQTAVQDIANNAGTALIRAWKRPDGQDEETIHLMHDILEAASQIDGNAAILSKIAYMTDEGKNAD